MSSKESGSPIQHGSGRLPPYLWVTLTLLVFSSPPALSATLPGKVKRVVDGDTLVVRTQGHDYRIRLAGIDAPERNQPWGESATRELRRQVVGRFVVADWDKNDFDTNATKSERINRNKPPRQPPFVTKGPTASSFSISKSPVNPNTRSFANAL